jgi:hypothetical protein
MSDSSGWQDVLDISGRSEAALIEEFVRVVRERDPDIIENHNIFEFDLRFLARRASALGVTLGLGRDGSEPKSSPATFKVARRQESFTSFSVAGRQVADTLHSVKRHGAGEAELRRHGLKESAKHFGFAKEDREYVPGAEVWPTYQVDPERIRRYSADDVEEVDALSRLLQPVPFELSRLLPRAFEKVCFTGSPRGLLEPLIIRDHLHAGRALKVREADFNTIPPVSELYISGLVNNVIRLRSRTLSARLALEELRNSRGPEDLFSQLLSETLALYDSSPFDQPISDACATLAFIFRAYLGTGDALLADLDAATRVGNRGRIVLDELAEVAQRHGYQRVEFAGDSVLLASAEPSTPENEAVLIEAMRPHLPTGVRPSVVSRYKQIYAHAELSTVARTVSGEVVFLGRALQPTPPERYGERFVREAAPLVLDGDVAALRHLYVETIARLRRREFSVGDVCVKVTLHRSPHEYFDLGQKQEPYEVLINAGVRTWRRRHRVLYFRDRRGELRLYQENSDTSSEEVDVEYYVDRLRSAYCQQYARAFSKADFQRIFAPPRSDELEEAVADSLRSIQLVSTVH